MQFLRLDRLALLSLKFHLILSFLLSKGFQAKSELGLGLELSCIDRDEGFALRLSDLLVNHRLSS